MLSDIKNFTDFKKLNIQDLHRLCPEIRERIISVMSKNGGHLASNLGVVELTTALHFVFDFSKDRLIFDVGHQCYTHKIITGRNPEFDMIRKKGGPSGFPRINESPFDPVDSGHASSSISSAVGYALAAKHNKTNSKAVVIIGDGSLTGGEAFEGLNQAGSMNLPLIVILNNNEMSIGKNVGALSTHISSLLLSKPYLRLTRMYERIMKKRKGIIKLFFYLAKRFKLINTFLRLKDEITRPVIVHVKTVKGKGFKPAEGNPSDFHGVTPSQMKLEQVEEIDANRVFSQSFTDVFSDAITNLARKKTDIVAITAAMESGTGLNRFRLEFPDRFYDVGIAEQHAVTLCGAMGHAGLRPVFAVYSTFLMRALDQLTQDVCISSSPVIIALDRAGIVGPDGETHQGLFDISYLRMLPNLTILAPSDANELELMLEYSYNLNKPVVIRYPRDTAVQSQLQNNHPDISMNPLVEVSSGTDTLIVVVGPFIDIAKEAVSRSGKNAGIVYLRFIKPTPDDLLINIISGYKKVVVIEESVYSGSVSEHIASLITLSKLYREFNSINLPDRFIDHDTRKNILTSLGFSAENLSNLI